MVNDIEAGKNKISVLDKIAFSCEQEYRRTEQQLQELIEKKNRLENMIVNVLNGDNEGYSKLRQIVKENVKAVLSENKQVVSIAFTALLQTLKADPEMVKLIYNIPRVNDGERPEENNNSIIKYLELNKERILNLGEKNYENLVEGLTNNAIDTAVTSSDLTLSLPSSSSSTFPPPSNQSGTYRKGESKYRVINVRYSVLDFIIIMFERINIMFLL